MTTLVVGASGATGQLVVQQLLNQQKKTKIVIRTSSHIPNNFKNNPLVVIIYGNVLEMSDAQLDQLVSGCHSVVSCLGHNLTLKGMFGHPKRLVTHTVIKLCEAIKRRNTETPTRFILMNSSGNQNQHAGEQVSAAHKWVISILRATLPPHVDNEQAADYLLTLNSPQIDWVAVRPDSLIDAEMTTHYHIHPSPIRDPIFNPGKTSRINVAHFISQLIDNDLHWERWRGKMPVIYNHS